jgi:hypothetical protein
MSPEQRRYLIGVCCLAPALVNALLNGLLGWIITLSTPRFLLWTVPGAAFDLVATAFGVALGTCLGLIIQVKKDYRLGKISLPPVPAWVAVRIARWPDHRLKGLTQSVWLGVLSVLVFAVPLLLALLVAQVTALERWSFIATKTALSAVEPMTIGPLVALKALSIFSSEPTPVTNPR